MPGVQLKTNKVLNHIKFLFPELIQLQFTLMAIRHDDGITGLR